MATVTRTGETFHVTDLSKEQFVALYEFLNDENDPNQSVVVNDEYLSNRSAIVETVEADFFPAYLTVVEEEEDDEA